MSVGVPRRWPGVGSMMRLIFWLSVLAVIAIPPAALVLGLDSAPMVPESQKISFQDVRQAQDLFARYDPRRMKPDEITTITASTAEINTAIGAALSGFQRVRSQVVVNRADVAIGATLELPLPANPVGRFVNLRTVIAPSDQGVEITRFAIGGMEIPPQLVKPLVALGFDLLVGAGKGDDILASVKSVGVAGDRITLVYRPPLGLVDDVKAAARRVIAIADPVKVRVYYERLHQQVGQAGGGSQSLARFVAELFRLAEDRSADRDPVEENKAAILALAMYFGDERFERLAGEVRTGALKTVTPRTDHVRLEGRHDWVQHFVVSAALVAAGGEGIANVIGEAKEVKDSDGPSGFSFTDIGADRAGVRFAERAFGSPVTARALQRALARPIDESAFFPRVGDLPEGLSEADFRRRYGDTNTADYNRMIAEIDRRIAAIPLYR